LLAEDRFIYFMKLLYLSPEFSQLIKLQ